MPKSSEHYMAVKKRADVELVHSKLEWIILRLPALTNQPGTESVSLSPAEIHTAISRDDVATTIANPAPQSEGAKHDSRSDRR